MPNITYKSCYYLFILLHEKFFVSPSVYFVSRILIDGVQHLISCDPKSKLTTRSIANTCKQKNTKVNQFSKVWLNESRSELDFKSECL